MTEYAVTVRIDTIVYVEANSVAEATDMGRLMLGVSEVLKVEIVEDLPPNTPLIETAPGQKLPHTL